MSFSSVSLAQARKALATNYRELMGRDGVNMVYIGFKTVDGKQTKEYAVICGVSKKLPADQLSKRNLLPRVLGRSVPTDVVEVGEVMANSRKVRHRPAPGGVSIGHYRITAGTLGCLVTDNENGEKLILSNNHVLANSNNASIGDAIIQPGDADGGTIGDKIATLLEYAPINFGSSGGGGGIGDGKWWKLILNIILVLLTWLGIIKKTEDGDVNYIDAAIARPTNQGIVSPNILEVGIPSGTIEPQLNMPVKKSGRTTGLTNGTIEGIHGIVRVGYGGNKVALFHDQIIMGDMSDGGDSGSLVLDNQNRAVGLLFAGSNTSTIASPISYVLEAFDVTI